MIKPQAAIRNLLFCIFLLYSFFGKADKVMLTEDAVYDDNIKSVLLYPTKNALDTATLDMKNPPIISMPQNPLLRLEFDELGGDFKNYFIKIINCNADWTVSQLNSIQYLNEYNEYQLSDRKLSYNTRVSYVHYEIFLPRVKISGNYLLLVYKDGDDQDFVITKRFVVYDIPLIINMEAKFPVAVGDRNTGQQIDFTINYAQYNLINPFQNLKVVLRQNFRWDNAITNLKPSFLNETSHALEYFFYNNESTFKGLNEYRFIDIRSNRFKGQNVSKVTFDANKTEIILTDDFNRSTQPYSIYFDFMNGRYIVQNYESGDTEIQPDYVFVNFVLNSAKLDEKVFITGGFNNYKADDNSEMIYNTAINKYTKRLLLKQGIYNYSYALKGKNSEKLNEAYFEGTYNLTQNVYDILVYYRPFGAISDQVIGYSSINYQGR